MSKFKETPCKYYIACGECVKGRAARHETYCQHCDQYYPRAKVRRINKKKQYNEKQRSKGEEGARTFPSLQFAAFIGTPL